MDPALHSHLKRARRQMRFFDALDPRLRDWLNHHPGTDAEYVFGLWHLYHLNVERTLEAVRSNLAEDIPSAIEEVWPSRTYHPNDLKGVSK